MHDQFSAIMYTKMRFMGIFTFVSASFSYTYHISVTTKKNGHLIFSEN